MMDNFDRATKWLQAVLAELNLAWEEFTMAQTDSVPSERDRPAPPVPSSFSATHN